MLNVLLCFSFIYNFFFYTYCINLCLKSIDVCVLLLLQDLMRCSRQVTSYSFTLKVGLGSEKSSHIHKYHRHGLQVEIVSGEGK